MKHKKVDDALAAMYTVMQNIPMEDPPVFVAVNLNNIPCVDLSNIDGAMLVCEQNRVKRQLVDMLHEQTAMKVQLSTILQRIGGKGVPGNNQLTYSDVASVVVPPHRNSNPAPSDVEQRSSTRHPDPLRHGDTRRAPGLIPQGEVRRLCPGATCATRMDSFNASQGVHAAHSPPRAERIALRVLHRRRDVL